MKKSGSRLLFVGRKGILSFVLFVMSFSLLAQYDSISHDGYDRTYLVHLPTGYSGSAELPMLIAMHGGFGNAYNLENQSQLSVKADQENFIVVYPEGVKGGLLEISSWNAGWCCGFSSKNNIDDVGFINALIDTLIAQFAIDTSRIYATGMSNGGFMSYRLACELSHRIAAIAPVAASMSMNECNPQRAVPMISFHSYLDENVPFDGGIGSGTSDHYNAPQDSVLNAWAEKNGCTALSDTLLNNEQYTHIRWSNCDCSVEIQHYITQDGGHSWPGGKSTLVGDPVSEFINANDLMWEFFQQYTLDCDHTSTASFSPAENILNVFPNPATATLHVQPSAPWEKMLVSLYTAQGQEVLKKANQTEINLENVPAGILFLVVEVDDYLKIGKIVVHAREHNPIRK